ncbi:MAG: hypothetical protein LIO91_06610 [Bacteroidales bacterium]|nr:hypothetical protein [Bacteroidales bacterium]
MNKLLTTILGLAIATVPTMAQGPSGQPAGAMGSKDGQQPVSYERKFDILLQNETNVDSIVENNRRIKNLEESNRALQAKDRAGLLGSSLQTAYGSALLTSTVNSTSNLLSYAVSALINATKSKQNEWYQAALQQCRFERNLKSETKTDDFYALPSQNGPMDPQDMKFKGFGLRYYLEEKGNPEHGQPIFKMFCRVKTDEEGIRSIVDHGKFLVELEELSFTPKYCGLPYDSCSRALKVFDFDKRKDLTFTITAKIYSSWFNEVATYTDDQLLGQFTVTTKIEKDMLNPADSTFTYDPTNPKHQQWVTLTGDCFMVPRSYTGTLDAKNPSPTWGTGQYRVEMNLVASCAINDSYYTVKELGNAKTQAQSALPGKTRWDKSKWQTEWHEMKAARKGQNFFQGAWESIVKAYKGDSWIETFTDPFVTGVTAAESQRLSEWLNLTSSASSMGGGASMGGSTGGAAGGTTGGNAGGGMGGAPSGSMPQGAPAQ